MSRTTRYHRHLQERLQVQLCPTHVTLTTATPIIVTHISVVVPHVITRATTRVIKLAITRKYACMLAASWQNQQNGMCVQRRLGSAWASAQSDQSLCCQHEERLGPELPIERTAKTLVRLGGYPGWSEPSLGAHSFCWFCHEAAHVKNEVYIFCENIMALFLSFNFSGCNRLLSANFKKPYIKSTCG